MDLSTRRLSIDGFTIRYKSSVLDVNSQNHTYRHESSTHHPFISYVYTLDYNSTNGLTHQSVSVYGNEFRIIELSSPVSHDSGSPNAIEYSDTSDVSIKLKLNTFTMCYSEEVIQNKHASYDDIQLVMSNDEILQLTYTDIYGKDISFVLQNTIVIGYKTNRNISYGYPQNIESDSLYRVWYISLMPHYRIGDSSSAGNSFKSVSFGGCVLRTCTQIKSPCYVLYKYTQTNMTPYYREVSEEGGGKYLIAHII